MLAARHHALRGELIKNQIAVPGMMPMLANPLCGSIAVCITLGVAIFPPPCLQSRCECFRGSLQDQGVRGLACRRQ
jgi:hypothetical protein